MSRFIHSYNECHYAERRYAECRYAEGCEAVSILCIYGSNLQL